MNPFIHTSHRGTKCDPSSFLRKVSEWKSLLLYSKRVLGCTFSSSLVIGLLLVTTPCASPASLAIKASELSSLHQLWETQGPTECETHTEGEGPGLTPHCSCPQPPFQQKEAEQISDVMMLFCFQCCFGWNQGLNWCLPEPKGPQVRLLCWRPKAWGAQAKARGTHQRRGCTAIFN